MNTRLIRFGLLLFPLACAIPIAAAAQTPPAKPAAHAHPEVSDAAARKQFQADWANLQKSPDDAALRGKVIAEGKNLKPAPPLPQNAKDDFAKATTQMRAALTTDEFIAAAKLFEQAAAEAPWFADADFSAASAYGKALDYDDARREQALYMAAVRPGVDTQAAMNLGHDVDRQQTLGQFQQAYQQFHANPTNDARIQLIKLAVSIKPEPEIPEEAHGHFVMAVVLSNTAEDNAGYERAIEQFKAASLSAPWWGDPYKKLAAAQRAAGKYTDAIDSLNLYELTQPNDSRDTQDEIYKLAALQQVQADHDAKRLSEQQQHQAVLDEQEKEHAANEAKKYTVAGRWYEIPLSDDFFVGGKAKPECDYMVNQSGGRWSITNGCSRSTWAIDKIQAEPREISFQLSGHDPGYPYSLVTVTFALSEDGKTLEGRAAVFNKVFEPVGDHTVRWARREE
jgi:tetratricopeptide (TPR) repeat protein